MVQQSNALLSVSTGIDGPFPSATLNDDLVKFNTIGSTNQLTHTVSKLSISIVKSYKSVR